MLYAAHYGDFLVDRSALLSNSSHSHLSNNVDSSYKQRLDYLGAWKAIQRQDGIYDPGKLLSHSTKYRGDNGPNTYFRRRKSKARGINAYEILHRLRSPHFTACTLGLVFSFCVCAHVPNGSPLLQNSTL